MSFLQSLRCKQNRHEWGDWATTETGEQECAQRRECTHCGVQETRRQSHAWGKWKYVEGTCKQERICEYCQAKRSRTQPHAWSEWKDVEEKCERQRVCHRCGEEMTFPRKHAWGEWEYVGDSCDQQRVCDRCGISEARAQHHTWEEWEEEEGRDEFRRVCGRCQARAKATLDGLSQVIGYCFDESELRDLCLKLGIEPDEIPGKGREKARELVMRFIQPRQRVGELIEVSAQLRPKAPWNAATMAEYRPYRLSALAELSEIFDKRFNREELNILCFDLGVDYDRLPGVEQGKRAREVVFYLARRQRIDDLTAYCAKHRPDIEIGDILRRGSQC